MAKLSAHGFEVARLVCETNVTNPDRSTDRERATYSFRSDGYVLIKHDVHFRERGEWHSYGWKLHRKLSDRKVPLWIYAITEQREAEALSVITRVLREYGTPYPRVTAERVVAALKEKEKLDG